MAKPLNYQNLINFGVNGLNTQDNPATLDPSYLTSANNVVIRESGRISFRKGFKQKVVPTGVAIGSMVEHNDQETNKIFASHGTSIYTVDFTSPNAAFPSSGADVKHTVANSTGDWQFVNFNNRLHCFHAGVAPQRYDGSLGSNVKWSSHYSAGTAINLANASQITAPNIALAKTYKITALGNTNFFLAGANVDAKVDDIFTSFITGGEAGDLLSTAANKMKEGKSYKIVALGDTDFNLNGHVGATVAVGSFVVGTSYKIKTVGGTDFTAIGASGNTVGIIFTATGVGSGGSGTAITAPKVDDIFTTNDILGIGTGLVIEVITGTTGTIVEIKTNPTLATITVDSTTGYATSGKIIIDDEIISYTGKSSTTFTGCTRGVANTTATHHLDNALVAPSTKPQTVTTFDPSCGMGKYGRLWCGGVTESKDVVYWSNLLDGDDWNGGDAGVLDLSKIWGQDEVVAIAPFYGQLIIFGKNNIAVYDNPTTVGSLALNEVISGIGCVSRDSIQAIGDDLVFLSATGLRSFLRTAEKDKVPLTDLTINIKDQIIRNIGQSTNVKSAYVENEGIYVMSFVDKNIQYVFDFKHTTPEATPRITTWTFDNNREPASMINTELFSGLLIGQKDGSIAGYEGYFDTDMSFVSSAVVLTNFGIAADVSSIWIPLGESFTASILKKLMFVMEGGSGATLGIKWYKDYSITPSATTQIFLAPTTTGTTALWGAATSLFGASKFTPLFGLQEYMTSLTGSAKNLKLNLNFVSNGYDTSLQELSIISLQGKLR